jgi:transcriptional regulator with PAS, ATPase and Fis domain
MANRRIEFPDDGSDFAQVLNLLIAYRDAMAVEDMGRAAGAADRAAYLSECLADEALVNAAGSERAIAAGMGLSRSTLQYRLKRARLRIRGESAN